MIAKPIRKIWDIALLRIILIGTVLNLAVNFAMAGTFKETGPTISWLATELYMTTAFFFLVRRAGIRIIDPRFYKK
jgi:O-antigen/teichoic acid export membrane protein